MKLTNPKIIKLLEEGKLITCDEFIQEDINYFNYCKEHYESFEPSITFLNARGNYLEENSNEQSFKIEWLEFNSWKECKKEEIIRLFK